MVLFKTSRNCYLSYQEVNKTKCENHKNDIFPNRNIYHKNTIPDTFTIFGKAGILKLKQPFDVLSSVCQIGVNTDPDSLSHS